MEKQTVLSMPHTEQKEQPFYSNTSRQQQFNREQSRQHDFMHDKDPRKEASKIMEQLIKPEQIHEPVNDKLIEKKRKRKRQFHHL